MRLPQHINIVGQPYSVKRTHDDDGSSFSNRDCSIAMGFHRSAKDLEMFEHFLHEVAEATLVELRMRYSTFDSNSQYVFVLSHKEFGIFIREMAGSLLPMLRKT